MPHFAPLLDRRHLMLLRATMGSGAAASEALSTWRASEKFEDTDDLTYRVMPLLAATADAAGLQDEYSRRMRGVVKHIWLSNMVRIRDLMEAKQALDRANIPVLLFKGGALFARDPQFAAMRAAGDYDLLVRRKDARRAVDVLQQDGFHSLGMRIDLFAEADFDRDIHAVAMSKSDGSKAIDLHWRAASSLRDEGLVEDLFASAETARLFGHEVQIPGLVEHLVLATIRPEPWDQKECLLRLIEIVQLLRSCRGALDWQRFEELVSRHGGGWIAAPLLALARDEGSAPIPNGIVDRLWRSAVPARSLELAVCKVPPVDRTEWHQLLLTAIRSLRFHVGHPFSWSHVLMRPATINAVLRDCATFLPYGRRAILKQLWSRQAHDDRPLEDEVSFRLGFSIPEPEGRWTDKEYALIEAPVDAGRSDAIRVTLELVPFLLPEARSLLLYVYAGAGKPACVSITRDHRMPFRLEVEAATVGTIQKKVVLVMSMPGRVRPRDVGLSIDHRLLGVFVRSVRVGSKSVFNPAAVTA